ncbi:uncharacterized protein OCT59_025529 [Rhizophagus irregularis]|uniref:uncharacterized protein n=1 Tax=Rhizophagus irregularis TaxID=588596 RepID=UPI003327C23E|nr:hypothetical protein OCT59_025529 [Rhizophagus irregularis]
MSTQFFSKLSKNYIELLDDDEYYDITIEVGEDPNVKIFRAHMNILCYRSPYLRRTLASNKKNRDNSLAHIKLSNISPEIFQIILKDDLQMKEIEVWEHVLKWGLAQNHTLIPDPNTWSNDDFKAMKNVLQHCLSLIRFFSLSSKDFLEKVRPYKRLLNHQLYEDLLKSHLDPKSEPNDSILFPRNIRIESIIDTKIVTLEIASTILKWIDKTVINNSRFDHLRELYLPYKFQLLLRGSRDGFTPKKFHELCDDKYNTITFIKVEGTEEIIGGYNPIMWSSSDNWGKTKHSFVFSFKEKDIKSAIISNIKDTEHALNYGAKRGPCFGTDIIIRATGEFVNYNIRYQKFFYEKKIRDTGNEFSIEDYEVFQIKERE